MLGNGEVVSHQSLLDNAPPSPAFFTPSLPPSLSTKVSLEPPLHPTPQLGKQSLFAALPLIFCEIWHSSLTFMGLCFPLYEM